MRFARFIVKKRGLILAIAVVLAVLSVFGLMATKINYDILTYLPSDLNSIVGEKALRGVPLALTTRTLRW